MTAATQPTLFDAPQVQPVFIVAQAKPEPPTCQCCTAYYDADELRRMWTNLGGGSWREVCPNCAILFCELRKNRKEQYDKRTSQT